MSKTLDYKKYLIIGTDEPVAYIYLDWVDKKEFALFLLEDALVSYDYCGNSEENEEDQKILFAMIERIKHTWYCKYPDPNLYSNDAPEVDNEDNWWYWWYKECSETTEGAFKVTALQVN